MQDIFYPFVTHQSEDDQRLQEDLLDEEAEQPIENIEQNQKYPVDEEVKELIEKHEKEGEKDINLPDQEIHQKKKQRFPIITHERVQMMMILINFFESFTRTWMIIKKSGKV
jgi:hypothetical protein